MFLKSISDRLPKHGRTASRTTATPAFLATRLAGRLPIEEWDLSVDTRPPDPEARTGPDELHALYQQLCTSTTAMVHALAARQHRPSRTTTQESR